MRRTPLYQAGFCYAAFRNAGRAVGAATVAGLWLILASSVATAAPLPPTLAPADPAPKVEHVPTVPAPPAVPVKGQPLAVPRTVVTARAKHDPASDVRLEQSAQAIDDGKFDKALELVAAAVAEGKLSESDDDWASYLTARALAGLGKADEAAAIAQSRYEANPNGYTWASLVAIYVTIDAHEKAADAILDVDEEQFIWVNKLRPALIETIVAALDKGKTVIRDRLITRLVEGRYSGPASQRVPDTLRLRYITMMLTQRRLEDAARQTALVETPTVLSILLTDRAFEVLWEHASVRALMKPGALVARVDRGVQARLEQSALSSSDWLDVMRSLRSIGRADEAVRLGRHALKQARDEKRVAGPALRLEMAWAYADTGETWAARRTARELLREEDSLTPAQHVAIAQVLDDAGDDEGALALLGALTGTARTPEVLQSIVCAAHDLGRIAKRDETLRELEAMADRAPVETFEALVCSGNKEKAAAQLAAMFKRPELRTVAILSAQLYADPMTPNGDQNDMRYRMNALVASAAVQEAIKPVGRSIALPFKMSNARPN